MDCPAQRNARHEWASGHKIGNQAKLGRKDREGPTVPSHCDLWEVRVCLGTCEATCINSRWRSIFILSSSLFPEEAGGVLIVKQEVCHHMGSHHFQLITSTCMPHPHRYSQFTKHAYPFKVKSIILPHFPDHQQPSLPKFKKKKGILIPETLL